jgi:hypothetical protein
MTGKRRKKTRRRAAFSHGRRTGATFVTAGITASLNES